MKGFQIQAELNALAENNVLNVISTPSLLVLNNQEAFINVGDRVPIPTTQSTNTNSLNGNNSAVVANNIQYQDTGVTLKVTPRVNPGGLVIMEIEQTSDTAIRTQSSDLNAPTISQRKITSSLATGLVITQITLGALVIDTKLHAVLVAIHLGIGIWLFAMVLLTALFAFRIKDSKL
jgi:general secretion pathway protein D